MKKPLLTIATIAAAITLLNAATITWTGGGDGYTWEDGNNWSSDVCSSDLKKGWTRYRIALDGHDLSRMKTGFAFTLGGPAKAFYLDDIEYVNQ